MRSPIANTKLKGLVAFMYQYKEVNCSIHINRDNNLTQHDFFLNIVRRLYIGIVYVIDKYKTILKDVAFL